MDNQQEDTVSVDTNSPSSTFKTRETKLENLDIDLENWMRDLPEHLLTLPLIYLAIPGSHNSFTYSISPSSGVSPDSPSIVQSLGKWCKPLINRIIFNWSQNQQEDINQQLRLGIRYIDARLVVLNNEILIAHGLYGGPIEEYLVDINSFLSSHEKEIVIVDFQHFYEFEPKHHDKLICYLTNIFGNKICYRNRRMRENTLKKLRESNSQILIIYRNQLTKDNNLFWPSGTWPTPWPNKVKVSELIDSLNSGLSERNDGMGYVSQGILTPTPKYVLFHAFGSLKKLASETNKKVISWVETKYCGASGINVVICDFVERNQFCKKVVLVNYRTYNY